MKKNICAFLCAVLFLSGGSLVFADIAIPFFGNNNFTIDVNTTFSSNLNNGATGLETEAGIGLWFEYAPYQDRNITPQRDILSVSLRLANSAFYAWRGYEDIDIPTYGSVDVADFMRPDQIVGIWFDTFIAQLEYNQFWIRIAGLEPEISLSQASIRSVMDPLINNRTAADKNSLPLPLFYAGDYYNGTGGIISVINRDIVNLNRREVVIAGNMSAGVKTDTFDFSIKAGSWKKAEENTENSWVGGGDFSWRPDLSNFITVSFLTAVNYGEVDVENNDPMSSSTALLENPFAVGLGYEYRINLPRRMILRPYAGIDYIYETKSGEYNYEIGGGLQWFFRGTGAQFKRNASIGGVRLGDVEIPAAFVAGVNVDRHGLMNAVISFNEDPHFSPLTNFGGFMQLEFMNITGQKYMAPNGLEYGDFLWAGIIQLEYLLFPKIMPYVFARCIPGDLSGAAPVYSKDFTSLTSKLGCRFSPIDFFSIDVWYERTDFRSGKNWAADNGFLSVSFGIRNYF
ncbi:MAG: hypothetical protein LBC80_00740 [Treponema sp.]|jgi:hypothetical protein|nr:hypothetical protein [Treponema sp.]